MGKLLNKLKRLWDPQHPPDEVKSFRHDQEAEEAFETFPRGKQRIPLDRICGSVGRYYDFDSHFRPKEHLQSDRYQAILTLMKEGRPIKPVQLYQLKDEYYVLDGNHRIAAAKALGWTDITATIVEFIPSGNSLESLLYRQRADFSKQTGLPYSITLTEVGQYDALLDQITRHQAHLARSHPESVTLTDAAQDWYEHIYRPLVAIIRKGNLLKYFPKRTLDDLYVYVSHHQWVEGRKRRYGIGIDKVIPNNMEAFRDKMANQVDKNYPEMLRKITAFVLMNVRARNERRIMEKLFALKEVQEVHSIHGNADVLIKIVLTRDLLSSDAEIISNFVADQMRQIAGVLSTQTLIPGQSMIKDRL